ncbi:MAG: acetoin utilization protein AcuB [Chloroflexi bacterium]|jgi:acetoin utilization protein AcuB|nr:MAG: acetoin utilization protein AcuB [Chloroflexota bacterium]
MPANDSNPHAYDAGTPVQAVMSRDVLSVDADTTLGAAREQMRLAGVHHLLVYDRSRLVAVISDRDLLAHLSPRLGTMAEQRDDTSTLLRRVFQAASYQPVTIPCGATIAAAAAILLRHTISCAPVTDALGEVVGVLTSRDLLGALSRMAPERRAS